MYQAPFFVALSLLGWAVTRRLLAEHRRSLAGLLGLAVGTTVFFWLAVVARAVEPLLGVGHIRVWWLLLALAIPIGLTCFRGPAFTRREIILGGCSQLLTILVVIVTSIWNHTLLWNDSLELVAVGELIRMGELFQGHELLTRRPLYYGIFHAFARDLGVEYLWAWVPATAATFLFAFSALLLQLFKDLGVRRLVSYALTIVGGGLLLSSDFGRLHLALQHIHLMYGERFFLFAFLFWAGTRDEAKTELWLGVALLSPTIGMRHEAVLFLPFALLVAITSLSLTSQRARHVAVGFGMVALAASAILITTIEYGRGFVDLKRAGLLPALGIAMLAIAAPKRVWNWLWPWARPVSLVTLFALFVVVAVTMFTHFVVAQSAICVAFNFLETGMWEFLWWAIAAWLVIGAASRNARFQSDTWFATLVGTYLIFLIPLVLVRDQQPYRLGGMDSANRMMMHILPCLIFLALGRLGAASVKSK